MRIATSTGTGLARRDVGALAVVAAVVMLGGCFSVARTDARVRPGWSGQVVLQGELFKGYSDTGPARNAGVAVPEIDVGYGIANERWPGSAVQLKVPISADTPGRTIALDLYQVFVSNSRLATGVGAEIGRSPSLYHSLTFVLGQSGFVTLTNRFFFLPGVDGIAWNPQLALGVTHVFGFVGWVRTELPQDSLVSFGLGARI